MVVNTLMARRCGSVFAAANARKQKPSAASVKVPLHGVPRVIDAMLRLAEKPASGSCR